MLKHPRASLIVRLFAGMLITLMTTRPALASTSPTSHVTFISIFSENNWATVTFDLPRTNLPTCVTAQTQQAFAFKINTDAGKAMLSVLLAAKLSGATVTGVGTGACTSETLPTGINTFEILKSVFTGPP